MPTQVLLNTFAHKHGVCPLGRCLCALCWCSACDDAEVFHCWLRKHGRDLYLVAVFIVFSTVRLNNRDTSIKPMLNGRDGGDIIVFYAGVEGLHNLSEWVIHVSETFFSAWRDRCFRCRLLSGVVISLKVYGHQTVTRTRGTQCRASPIISQSGLENGGVSIRKSQGSMT